MSSAHPLRIVAVLGLSLLLTAIARAESTTPTRAFPHPPAWLADQTVYEVNLRQFSPEGNVAGLRKQLPRLKALGIGTLWLMPIHPIGAEGRIGGLGSPYAVKDYLAFNPELGTFAAFKELVDEAHRLGLYVILDWVAPHTALDHPWVKAHPDWYNRDANGQLKPPAPEWKDVAGLNYGSAEMRRTMIDAMAYWVRETGVDGFRCDSAEFVPLDFWIEARDTMRKIKPVFMLAEGNKPELVEHAFDAAYAWDLPVNMEGIVRGSKTATDIANYFNADARVMPRPGARFNFTTNHDKNAFEGTTREQLGDGAAAFAVLSFTAPGVPMVFNGQENGDEKRLSLFDRDPIPWRKDPAADLYASLARLKRNHPALWSGPTASPMKIADAPLKDGVLLFERQAGGDRVVVCLNLSAKPARVTLPAGTESLTLVLGKREQTKGSLTLQPWEYLVWANSP